MEWKTEWWSNGWKQYWLKVYFPFGTIRVLMLQLYRTRDLSSAVDYRKLESVDGNRFCSALFISVDVLWGSDSLGKCCFPSGTCIRISFFSREISWNIVLYMWTNYHKCLWRHQSDLRKSPLFQIASAFLMNILVRRFIWSGSSMNSI